MQFSIRIILAATILVAVWLALFRGFPHIAVFATAFVPLAFAIWVVGPRRKRENVSVPKWAGWLLLPVALFYFYLLSIGPVVAASEYFSGIPNTPWIEYVYAPVIWLHDTTPLARPLELYAESWGWR